MLSKSQDCPPNVGGVARPLEGWLNANPCRVRGAQRSVRRRTRKGTQRRGYYPTGKTHYKTVTNRVLIIYVSID